MDSPTAMARLMRSTARSMSFIRKGEWISCRSRSRKTTLSSAPVTPRAAKTALSSAGYPAPRRLRYTAWS